MTTSSSLLSQGLLLEGVFPKFKASELEIDGIKLHNVHFPQDKKKHGAEADVFCGYSKDLGKSVAAKWYNRRLEKTRNCREIEFLLENSSNCREHNIVELFAVLMNDRHQPCGFVMELMSKSLDQIIHDDDCKYDENQIALWIGKISKAISFLHDHDIAHRDVKPQNILIGDQLDSLKLADFGIMRPQVDAGSLTYGMGTLRYMAPEICSASYGKPVDIFSLSVTVWEIVTRQVPYSRDSNAFSLRNYVLVLDGSRPDLENFSNKLLKNLLRRGWLSVPEERPPISEFLAFAQQAMIEQKPFLFKRSQDIREGRVEEIPNATAPQLVLNSKGQQVYYSGIPDENTYEQINVYETDLLAPKNNSPYVEQVKLPNDPSPVNKKNYLHFYKQFCFEYRIPLIVCLSITIVWAITVGMFFWFAFPGGEPIIIAPESKALTHSSVSTLPEEASSIDMSLRLSTTHIRDHLIEHMRRLSKEQFNETRKRIGNFVERCYQGNSATLFMFPPALTTPNYNRAVSYLHNSTIQLSWGTVTIVAVAVGDLYLLPCSSSVTQNEHTIKELEQVIKQEPNVDHLSVPFPNISTKAQLTGPATRNVIVVSNDIEFATNLLSEGWKDFERKKTDKEYYHAGNGRKTTFKLTDIAEIGQFLRREPSHLICLVLPWKYNDQNYKFLDKYHKASNLAVVSGINLDDGSERSKFYSIFPSTKYKNRFFFETNSLLRFIQKQPDTSEITKIVNNIASAAWEAEEIQMD